MLILRYAQRVTSLKGKAFAPQAHGATRLRITKAYSGSLDAAKMLVSCGADVNAKDKAGVTPRALAQGQGHVSLASYIKGIVGK